MDKITPKMGIAEDLTMEHAYRTYRLLEKEVRSWLDERGNFWTERLRPAETPPYYPLVDLPEVAVLELWQRLNRVEGVVVSESDLREKWIEFKAVQPVTDTEMLSRLYMALSGVARLSRETIIETKMVEVNHQAEDHQGEIPHESRACLICGEDAALSVLTSPNGKRYMHCMLCGHEWPAKRVGCICCGSEEASEQIYLRTDEFPGVDMVVCQVCGQYFKEVDLRVLSVEDFVWEDVRTLPLNYAAEQWFAERAKLSGNVQ